MQGIFAYSWWSFGCSLSSQCESVQAVRVWPITREDELPQADDCQSCMVESVTIVRQNMAQLYCVVIWHRYIRHRSTLWHKLNSYYVQFNSSAAYDLVLTQTQISTQYTGCSNQGDARVIHNSSSYTDNRSLPSWSSLSSAQWALKRRDFESNPGGILQ